MATLITSLCGWGRYPVQSCELERPERYANLRPATDNVIARGQGRSYGDAALNEGGRVLLTERVNRLLEFDVGQGVLRAEAGATLAEILEVIVPKGWFLPVTPGTKFVSLGGCVAADVHGKNHHHDGSFGDHVLAIELFLADGSRVNCSATEKPELYWATVGGMGLTGIIGEVTLKLIPIQTPHMMVRHHQAGNLEQLFTLLQNPISDDRYSVAWIDSMAGGKQLGRGIAMCGHHALAEELPPGYRNPAQSPLFISLPRIPSPQSSPASGRGSERERLSSIPTGERDKVSLRERHVKRNRAIPFDLPSLALNPLSIAAFNALYYRREGAKRQPFISSHDAFFYPLDAIGDWNRMYGKRGFVQYQCVIPQPTAFDGIASLLQELSGSGRPSFLAVLKRLGAQNKGLLSFPMAGYTLALDLPIRSEKLLAGHPDEGLFALLDKLDRIVLQHGGRVYLAKDARLAAESFRAMYPRYEEWLKIKRALDPQNMFGSSLSRRLKIGAEQA